ncbi:MAG: NADH:ubiquinone reductase (Na(+)-transporting) subunit A [Candidatus Marinimicrobia bacterium]|mgnify:CR=1 FL=1|nr:NADH:ubiquinone reductase (Na(+)-transporting) subunit A [Candidatus Neomarinimicrobiota bacterium]
MTSFKLKEGINIPLLGKPKKTIKSIDVESILKIHPNTIKGIKPKLSVKEGEHVKIGSMLFHDKVLGDVNFVSPGAGVVQSIKLGERRVIEEICIDISGKNQEFKESKTYSESEILNIDKLSLKKILKESGCWTYLRQRPFSKIANPEHNPKAIFISGYNTAPHALDYEFILNENNDGLQAGINALNQLTDGDVHISINGNKKNLIINNLNNVKVHNFTGPHPTGNIGIQIHHIDPINVGEVVWYIDLQDVIAIGKQLTSGKFSTEKYISISGEGIKKPTYAKVKRGITIQSALNNNLKDGKFRFISGDVLSGKKVQIESGLGYYHNQISVIPEGGEREFIGWLKPGKNKYTISNTYISRFFPKKEWSLNTLNNGDPRAIVPLGTWERVLPMDIHPNYLVRSIIAKDIEEMEDLGIYECDEEDFALCSFVCQSKFPVHEIIRDGLNYIEKEG